MRFNRSLIAVLLLGLALVPPLITPVGAQRRPQQGAPPPARRLPVRDTPPLVVLLAVDQFSSQYINWYGATWTKGLRRLVDQGASFPLAAFPYALTWTCPGHVTIGTGTFPRTHGMVANEWYDRDSARVVTCTDQPDVEPVGLGGLTGRERHGPRWLAVNTFADELRNQAAVTPRVTSVSLKARSAIGLAGHTADVITWLEDAGVIASSTAFLRAPSPALNAFATTHAVAGQYGRVWDRLRPSAAYRFADDGLNEYAADGLTRTFPHPQTRPGGQADRTFVTNWERTPFSDEILTEEALAFSEGYGLGTGTDVLAVSYTSLDYVGHRYGPKSHEVQDTLLRLDVQIGRLLDTLDRRLGPNGYVVALSADHGVAPIPEQVVALGLDGGRYQARELTARLVDAWRPYATSEASPIASNNGTDVYFTPATLAALDASPAARHALTSAALAQPGVLAAYWAADLTNAGPEDLLRTALARSYYPGRSADLLLIPKPHWMVGSGSMATHGTPHAYDQRVPVILMGWGIKPGRYLTTVTPADIAPTLAHLTHVSLPRADGRVLAEALR